MLPPYHRLVLPQWGYERWAPGFDVMPNYVDVGGLGTSGLGAAQTLISDPATLMRQQNVYTYRTSSPVPLQPAMRRQGWVLGAFDKDAWEYAASKSWSIAPSPADSGIAAFYQARTLTTQPNGTRAYATSLSLLATREAMPASSMIWAARQILNYMNSSNTSTTATDVLGPGWLYDREVAAAPMTATSAGDRAEETRRRTAVAGRDRLVFWSKILAVAAAALGAYMATRRGSRKIERVWGPRLAAGGAATARGAGRAVAGTARGIGAAVTLPLRLKAEVAKTVLPALVPALAASAMARGAMAPRMAAPPPPRSRSWTSEDLPMPDMVANTKIRWIPYGGGNIYPSARHIGDYAKISRAHAKRLVEARGFRLPRPGYVMTLEPGLELHNTSGRFELRR